MSRHDFYHDEKQHIIDYHHFIYHRYIALRCDGLHQKNRAIDTRRPATPRHFANRFQSKPSTRLCQKCRLLYATRLHMLFIVPNELRRSFWMSHTYLPLDIVFIDKDGTVSNFYKNAKPLDERPRYTSNKRVRYVLELPAGSIERFGIDNSTTFDTTQFNQYKAE